MSWWVSLSLRGCSIAAEHFVESLHTEKQKNSPANPRHVCVSVLITLLVTPFLFIDPASQRQSCSVCLCAQLTKQLIIAFVLHSTLNSPVLGNREDYKQYYKNLVTVLDYTLKE